MAWYLQQGFWSEYSPATLYVGGGTPSLAIPELLAWLAKYRESRVLNAAQEVTMEVNPGAISAAQLQQLVQAGFTRLSIGVQSFHDEELRILGRIHTRDEAFACVQAAREAGVQNLNLDLIFGIPEADRMMWVSSLKTALALEPEHLSLYNLTLEEGTPFWQQSQQGELTLPSEEVQLDMYETGMTMLTCAGYEQYEISNFARPGYRSQHNQIYWQNGEYVGLGAGAYSYLKGRRYWNHADLQHYLTAWLNEQHPAVAGEERLSPAEQIGETIIMNLRMLEGIDLERFRRHFGQALETLYAETIEKFSALGLLEIQDNRLRLTSKGLFLSDEIFQGFVR